MTVALTFFLVAVLFVALLWLLLGRRSPGDLAQEALEIHELLPVHCKYFPQIQNLLNSQDQDFVGRRVPLKIAKQWSAERRAILRLYIQGLREDFRRMEKLARLLAALSPEVKRAQEWEWFGLSVQFRLLYVAMQLRLAAGILPAGELARVAETLTALRLMLESTMNGMAAIPPTTEETITH